MPRKRYSTEQIITKLRQAEVELSRGLRTPQVCKKLGISEQTYYRWRKEYGGLRLDQAKWLKVLEQENVRLKKLVVDQALDNAMLKQGGLGKLLSPPRRRQAVAFVCRQLGVSERRACRVIEQARATHRHRCVTPTDEPRLVDRMNRGGDDVWPLRLSVGRGPAARGRVARASQTRRAPVAPGRAESPVETAETGPLIVGRWVLYPPPSRASPSRLGV